MSSYQHWLLLARFIHLSSMSDSLGWCNSLTTLAPWPPGAGEAAAHLPSTHSLSDFPGARVKNGRISRAQLSLPEFRSEAETVPSIEARQTESLRVPYFFRSCWQSRNPNKFFCSHMSLASEETLMSQRKDWFSYDTVRKLNVRAGFISVRSKGNSNSPKL